MLRYHLVTAACSLALASSPTATVGLFASETAAASPKAAESKVAEKVSENPQDKEFEKYVDLRLLGVAQRTLNARLMTDVALQLREGEKNLKREHSVIGSKSLLELCEKVAAEGKDLETIKRLQQVAKSDGDQQKEAKLTQIAGLIGQSRDARDDAMFSARDIELGAPSAYGNYILQIRAAQLAGDSEALKHLKIAIGEQPSLQEAHRKKLFGVVDGLPGTDGTSGDPRWNSLQQLIGPARDFDPGSPYVPQVAVPDLPQAKVIQVQPGGAEQVSHACGGMRYFSSPSGAVVQSYGRLGTILFEPGDVIMAIGGFPATESTSLDQIINNGYLTSQRSVIVRDRNTGRVVNLFY